MFMSLLLPTAEVGIEMKFKGQRYPVLIGATHVPELNAIEVGLPGALIGCIYDGWMARMRIPLEGVVCARCCVCWHST